ncbi:MAG TPA: hypothetical protein ENI61_01150 [Ignavibacteria bacterium]|mgnify:CR=1 FL=1|nr:hypothetical protein [Ignavibacteria bacterium]
MAGKTYKYNIFTGNMDIVQDSSVIVLKAVADTVNDLPLTGNTENDLFIVRDTDSLYTWNNPNPNGVIGDWVNAGTVAGVDWSGILNGPGSTPAQIDNAVVKAHAVNQDTKLDEGGVNEKNAFNLVESIPVGDNKRITGLTYNNVTNQIVVFFDNV